MFHSNQRRQGLSKGIFSLWKNWVTAVGFIAALTFIAPLIPPKWVPLTALFLELIILYLDRANRQSKMPSCFRLPSMAGIALFITALLSLLILFLFYREDNAQWDSQPVNPRNPMLIVLIVSPVMTIIAGYYMWRGLNSGFCKACEARNGNAVDRGFLGTIFSRESRYQTRFLFTLSLLISIICWTYYCTVYINVNINSADSFFFIYMPSTIYVLSLIYIGARYYTMWTYYTNNEQMAKLIDRSGTRLRFIIVSGDRIFLSIPSPDTEAITSDDTKIDIPVRIALPFREKIGKHEADEMFINASAISDAKIRFVFESHDYAMYNNIFHYIAFIDDPEKVSANLNGEWFTLPQINELISGHLVSTIFAAELSRIYTIAMAWKTYDARGFRLYDIKHYRPTFRLHDLPEWDVDFNDDKWLLVSSLNQDKPFFRIRRFWKKHIKGLGV